MKIVPVRRHNGNLGFKRVNLIQWALSKIFPYRLPSILGSVLVRQKCVTIDPSGRLKR